MSLAFDRKYKGHHIRASADQDPYSKRWMARALVSWEQDGKRLYMTLYGKPNECETVLRAIERAVDLAIIWIDDGKPQV